MQLFQYKYIYGEIKFVFLGQQTINGYRRLLFQQTCPSMPKCIRSTSGSILAGQMHGSRPFLILLPENSGQIIARIIGLAIITGPSLACLVCALHPCVFSLSKNIYVCIVLAYWSMKHKAASIGGKFNR